MITLNIVKNKILYLCISAILLLPGIIAMIYSSIIYPNHAPLKVGIDYTGGTTLQYGVITENASEHLGQLRTKLEEGGVDNPYLQIINVNSDKTNSDFNTIISVRTKFIDENSDDTNKISQIISSEYDSAELIQVSYAKVLCHSDRDRRD